MTRHASRREGAVGSRWAAAAGVAAGFGLCLLPFLGKPFHLDDPMFLWAAEHIQRHPFDFYGFEVNWNGWRLPMAAAMLNPPLVSYYLALAAGLVGWSEPAIHGAMLLPALALALGVRELAERLCPEPELASLCALFTPVAVVSATTVMSDVAMLALWCWSAALWLRGLDTADARLLLAGAGLAALCPLAKYFGLSLVPLLFVYTLVRERRLGAWALYLLLPLFTLAAYELLLGRVYGASHLFGSARYVARARAESALAGWEHVATGLCFLGGGLLTSLGFAPLLWSRRGLWLGVAALLAALVFLAGLGSLGGLALREDGALRWGPLLQTALYAAAGVHLVALAAADLWRSRDAGALLLGLWIVGVLVFASFVNWTTNGRAILPAAPAAGILVLRAARARPLPARLGRRALGLPLLPGLALALAVAQADASLAAGSRTVALDVAERYARPHRTLWFQGTWGFQWYLAGAGGQKVDFARSTLGTGDLVVLPEYGSGLLQVPAARVALLEAIAPPAPRWGSTMDPALGAGFYSDVYGPLPFAFGRARPSRYWVYAVRAPFRFGVEFDPAALP